MSTRSQQPVGLVVMMNALAVLSIDLIQRFLHLYNILYGASIQCLLYHRLLGTCTSAKGEAQRWIAAQTGIDFYHSMRSCQQTDKSIIELINWRILDGFLLDLHDVADRLKQLELTQLYSNSC